LILLVSVALMSEIFAKDGVEVFKEFGDVYLIKNANHFLRNNIAKK